MSADPTDALCTAFHFLAVNLIDTLLREEVLSAQVATDMFDRAEVQMETEAARHDPQRMERAIRYLQTWRLAVIPPFET